MHKAEIDDSGLRGEPYEVAYLVLRLEQIAVSIFYDLNSEIKLTPTQYSVLSAIRDFPGSQQGVGRIVSVDRTSINDMTPRLYKAGFVSRELKGRNILVSLTEKGHELLDLATKKEKAYIKKTYPHC